MSLPNTPNAVDASTNTHTFWNELVENYEAIFDGSAFDDGTVQTKYGTVARYVRLHSGMTSQAITLVPGELYAVLILNSDYTARTGTITQGGSPVVASGFNYSMAIFTPGVSSLMCSSDGSGSWSGVDIKFVIIKLNNNAAEWANSASIPYTDLAFVNDEVLQASKVNKVIANVNSSETEMNVLGIEKMNLDNNTTTSMVLLGFMNGTEVTTPASIPAENVVSELEFEITANLTSCRILISASAEWLYTSNDYYPVRIDIRDSEDNIIGTQDFGSLNAVDGEVYSTPANTILTGLSAGIYTVEVVYSLDSSGTHAVNTAYSGITNILVMALGA